MKLLHALAVTATTILLSSSALHASPPTWGTDVIKALSQAKKEGKMGFILMGRENCGNCQATRTMVNEGKVPVSTDKFVVADINIDDPRDAAEFEREFKKERFGNILPFVVITDTKGKALASYSGYKNVQELTQLLNDATAKAEASAKK